ncbi:MAG: PIN domain-containing protein [Candidatus Aminicenantes bacterium]|nr:PIN domain-containing protein [Candidatus Aminicenantes bacterium]NIM78895.1 PIN domain-containing protein [Candidatus Aminicenantes bacterium]NIN18151.1 PIN domain-containing protein [Candidatus Aminicenantes bacterium]NIN42050.1 PIN domain-containing protein [Candidatus Aminicenantes bacterium]NIN84806.1 PIN domain-containing protein [Candidatus Aminicenantes bacterium]
MDSEDKTKEYVLDSFAFLAHLENEERGTKVTNILKDARGSQNIILYASVINIGEVYYITMRERGKEKAEEVFSLIKLLPVQIIEADTELTIKASRLKAKYPVAYADCFAASLAIEKDASLITGDPEFKKMEEEVKVEWI